MDYICYDLKDQIRQGNVHVLSISHYNYAAGEAGSCKDEWKNYYIFENSCNQSIECTLYIISTIYMNDKK